MAELDLKLLAAFLGVSCENCSYTGDQKIPVLHVNNGAKLRGILTISKYLTKEAKKAELLGVNAEDQAAVTQWVEYRLCNIDRCASEKDTQAILHDLNSYLSSRVYLVSHFATLADILLYYSLHYILAELSFYEKQKYMHVSRWFNQVQHLPGVRQALQVLPFQKNRLYSGASH